MENTYKCDAENLELLKLNSSIILLIYIYAVCSLYFTLHIAQRDKACIAPSIKSGSIYNIQCTHSVHTYTVYTIHYTVYTIHYTVYCIQCNCTVYTVH